MNQPREMRRCAAVVYTLAGISLIAISIAHAAHIVWEGLAVADYAQTRGLVESSTMEAIEVGRIALYKPQITYRYTVDGVEYRNNRYDPLDDDGSKDWAEQVVRDYPHGMQCIVYYDAHDPQKSVLSIHMRSVNGWTAALAGLFGVMATCRGISAYRAC